MSRLNSINKLKITKLLKTYSLYNFLNDNEYSYKDDKYDLYERSIYSIIALLHVKNIGWYNDSNATHFHGFIAKTLLMEIGYTIDIEYSRELFNLIVKNKFLNATDFSITKRGKSLLDTLVEVLDLQSVITKSHLINPNSHQSKLVWISVFKSLIKTKGGKNERGN